MTVEGIRVSRVLGVWRRGAEGGAGRKVCKRGNQTCVSSLLTQKPPKPVSGVKCHSLSRGLTTPAAADGVGGAGGTHPLKEVDDVGVVLEEVGDHEGEPVGGQAGGRLGRQEPLVRLQLLGAAEPGRKRTGSVGRSDLWWRNATELTSPAIQREKLDSTLDSHALCPSVVILLYLSNIIVARKKIEKA